MLGELEEAKEARAGSEREVQQLHKQLLRLEENAEADLARAAEEVFIFVDHMLGALIAWQRSSNHSAAI